MFVRAQLEMFVHGSGRPSNASTPCWESSASGRKMQLSGLKVLKFSTVLNALTTVIKDSA